MAQTSDREDEEEEYFVPLTDQRVFGAGIKRKRIAFVPATTEDNLKSKSTSSSSPSHTNTTSTPILTPGDRYLAIITRSTAALQPPPSTTITPSTTRSNTTSNTDPQAVVNANEKGEGEGEVQPTPSQNQDTICSICNQIISRPSTQDAITKNDNSTTITRHESSIAHQICLPHSHPPSHLNRSHVGLKYLSVYGWDPDSRTGLGARGEGIRVPVKAREKRDTAGLGANHHDVDDDDEDEDHVVKGKMARRKEKEKEQKTKKKMEDKVVMVNAKEVRRIEGEKKKKAERLRVAFYADDYTKYLGPAG